MIEAKSRNNDNQKPRVENTPSIRNFLKINFPKSFEIERQNLDLLREHTSIRVKDYPENILKAFNLVNEIAIKRGYEEVLVNPVKEAKIGTYITSNSFVLPERFLGPLSILLSSKSSSIPEKFAADGIKQIIKQQEQFIKGETLEKG